MYHPSTPMAGGPNMQMVTGPGGAPMSSPMQMGQRMGGPIPPSMTQPGPGQYAGINYVYFFNKMRVNLCARFIEFAWPN